MRIKLNPDKEKVKDIRQHIKDNDGYCCCRLEKIQDNICPCYEFRYNQNCDCELYIKVEE